MPDTLISRALTVAHLGRGYGARQVIERETDTHVERGCKPRHVFHPILQGTLVHDLVGDDIAADSVRRRWVAEGVIAHSCGIGVDELEGTNVARAVADLTELYREPSRLRVQMGAVVGAGVYPL